MTRVTSMDQFRPIEWSAHRLRLLDQTLLPREERWVECVGVECVAEAIRSMRVRGAPAIGVAAAAGMALAAREGGSAGGPREALERAAEFLAATRPTAVNLGWALDRCRQAVAGLSDLAVIAARLDALVGELLAEQEAADRAIAEAGAALLPDGARVLTHCNTGGLATGAYGTALGVIRRVHEQGRLALVYADESRPRLQGARLTAWELQRLGIPFRLLADGAAAALMARGLVDAVVVGADRVAGNGDVANKIGTYGLAIAAAHHRIPLYVAAPVSTLDVATPDGSAIPIEERSPDEVLWVGDERIAPEGAEALNPAFDVTPAALVTAIVTERGVLRPPYGPAIRAVVESSGDDARSSGGAGERVEVSGRD